MKNNIELKINYVLINDITPYINNSRTHPQEQIDQIKASINEFGMCNPILIHDKTIVAGHGRFLALQQLEFKKIPTIDLSHLSDTQRKAYIIADNKIGDNSKFDDELLKMRECNN